MIREHGLIYVFNLVIKENNLYFYPYLGGKENVLSVLRICKAQNYLH